MCDTSGSFHIAEGEPSKTPKLSSEDDEHARSVERGEAVIAVFQNDKLVVQDHTFALNSSTRLQVKPGKVEKLTLQYKLQSRETQDTQILQYLDVEKLLKDDRIGNWSFLQDHKFNPIFRRHLEHILYVCLVNVTPNSDQQLRYAFISDFTFESGSSAVNDL